MNRCEAVREVDSLIEWAVDLYLELLEYWDLNTYRVMVEALEEAVKLLKEVVALPEELQRDMEDKRYITVISKLLEIVTGLKEECLQ